MSEVAPTDASRALTVAFLAAEMAPLVKIGGLADVTAALTAELARLGVRVVVCLPAYRQIFESGVETRRIELPRPLRLTAGDGSLGVTLHEVLTPSTASRVLLVDHPPSFDRAGVYDDPKTNEGYPDNDRRFLIFQRACLEGLRALDLRPDLFHLNDYQTALVPACLKTLYADDPFYAHTGTLLTIHNLGYQGIFPAAFLGWAGLPQELFYPNGPLEFWGRANFLKAGIVQADRLTTVSPTYAREIQSSSELGFGLEGVLRERSADLTGILNGIDLRVWNPGADAALPAAFSAEDLAGKAICKRTLLRRVNLPADDAAPVIGLISRLVEQKGIDLLLEAADQIVGEGFRMVVLGSGLRRYEEFFDGLKQRHPEQVAVSRVFDDPLAHLIEAGSDFFIMPSRYEPCGLNQIMSLRYGTLPIVRETGGFMDTVEPYSAESGDGTGFLFRDFTAASLLGAVRQARQLYNQPDRLNAMRRRAMERDFSWARSAARYLELYRTVAALRPGPAPLELSQKDAGRAAPLEPARL